MTKDVLKRFTFRMPEHLYNALKEESKRLGVSMNSLILHILGEWEKRRDLDGMVEDRP